MMLFRFHRSIRIAPGVRLKPRPAGPFRFGHSFPLARGIRLNVGKRGLFTSLGGRGARVAVGRNTRATVSAPGHRPQLYGQRHTDGVVTVVIWGTRLLGAAVMMALLWL
jgi:hypothetical protein